MRLRGLQDNLPWSIDEDRVLLYDLCLCRLKLEEKDAILVHAKVEHDLAEGELCSKARREDVAEGSKDSGSESDFTRSPGSSDESEIDSVEEEADVEVDDSRPGEWDWCLDRREMLDIFHEISEREYDDIRVLAQRS